MISDTDAYRILGLTRGATTDEIKRAYRRLAKVHHPDAAGEKNLPRFLAIQQAYEQLTDGLDGPARPRRPSAARRPWDADPDRADATRRAYGGRARGASGGPAAGGGAAPGAGGAATGSGGAPTAGGAVRGRRRLLRRRPGGSGGASTAGGSTTGGAGRSGSTRSPGSSSGEPAAGSTRDGRRRRRTTAPPGSADPGAASSPGADGAARPAEPKGRKRNKATLGSTSYDGVDGPFEPDWRGASWYGTTSGTYWTLNPKEYADPRKHGPEYQARARRATRARSGGGTPQDAPTGEAAAAPGTPDLEPPLEATGAREPGAAPTHTTSSWWESTTGATGPDPDLDPDWAATAGTRTTDQRTVAPPPPDLGRAMADIGRALTDDGFGGMRGRVARAIIGWLPIAFGIGWLAGEMTGCGRFAATCDGTADPFVLLLQAAVLAVLLLVPLIASVTVMGSIALLSAAIVGTLILSATGEAADGDARRSVLGAVLLLAWLAGMAIALVRRVRSLSPPATPVS